MFTAAQVTLVGFHLGKTGPSRQLEVQSLPNTANAITQQSRAVARTHGPQRYPSWPGGVLGRITLVGIAIETPALIEVPNAQVDCHPQGVFKEWRFNNDQVKEILAFSAQLFCLRPETSSNRADQIEKLLREGIIKAHQKRIMLSLEWCLPTSRICPDIPVRISATKRAEKKVISRILRARFQRSCDRSSESHQDQDGNDIPEVSPFNIPQW